MNYLSIVAPGLLLGMAGCTTPSAHASYVAASSPADTTAIALAVSDFLRSELPPAQTTLAFAPGRGPGAGLVEQISQNLRLDGFAVAEPSSGTAGAQEVQLSVAPFGYGYAAIVQYGNQEATTFFNRDTQGTLELGAPFTMRDTAPAVAPTLAGNGVSLTPATYDGVIPAPPLLPSPAPALAAPQLQPVTPPTASGPSSLFAALGAAKSNTVSPAWHQAMTSPALDKRNLTADDLNKLSLKLAADKTGPAGPATSSEPTAQSPRSLAGALKGTGLSPLPIVTVSTEPVVPEKRQTPSRDSLSTPINLLPPVHLVLAPPPLPTWVMEPGTLDGEDLKEWGKSIGWTVEWRLNQDWAVPNRVVLRGSFKDVATQVLNDMASQGAALRAHFWEGNDTLIVYVPGENDAP